MLVYAAREHHTRRRFWSIDRRVRSAISTVLEMTTPKPKMFIVLLQTGEEFLVELDAQGTPSYRQVPNG